MMRSVSARGAWVAALLCAATMGLGCGKKGDDGKGSGTAAASASASGSASGSASAVASASGSGSASGSASAAAPPQGTVNLVPQGASGLSAIQTSNAPKVDPKQWGDPTKIAAPKVAPAAPKMSGLMAGGGAEPTGFSVVYDDDDGSDPVATKIEGVLRDNQVFEKIAQSLNATIKIPRAIPIQFTKCGVVNAFYDPSQNRIIMCREFLSYLADVFKPVAKDTTELGNGIVGAMIFAFFHETGHCLIDQLQLPATGREEDAVDDFSTYVLSTNDETAQMALAGAYWFHLQAQSGDQTPFSDEHAFDDQRFYNIICHIYGSDPDKYKGMIDSGTLPAERAQRCPDEYKKIHKAWETLLKPYLTESAAQNASENAGEQPAAPPPVAAADQHQISCQQAVDNGLMLYLNDLKEQAKTWTQDQIDKANEQLKEQLPQVEAKLVETCNTKNWDDATRQCLMQATDWTAAQKCGS